MLAVLLDGGPSQLVTAVIEGVIGVAFDLVEGDLVLFEDDQQ